MKQRGESSLRKTAGTNQKMAYRIDPLAPELQAGHPSTTAVVATTLTNTANNSVAKVAAQAVGSSEAALKADVQRAWVAYQTTETYGIELGRALFDYRGGHKCKGGHGSAGKGLVQLLDELGIPHSTGYWWINRYEVSVGLKEPKQNQVAPLPSVSAAVLLEPELQRESEPESEAEREHSDGSKKRRGRRDPGLAGRAQCVCRDSFRHIRRPQEAASRELSNIGCPEESLPLRPGVSDLYRMGE